MGNYKKNPPEKAQPRQVLLTGETGGLGVKKHQPSQQMIRIRLVRLNLTLLKRLSLYDRVSVIWQDENYYCLYNKEVVGMVPGNYNKKLNVPASYKASVVEVTDDPPVVIIELNV